MAQLAMALVSATEPELTVFLAKYGYSIEEDGTPLLALSFAFLSTLPFRDVESVDVDRVAEAQCFIAYSMSANGGGFDPSAIAEAKTLIKEGLGRGAMIEEYSINTMLSGTDPISRLRSLPLAFGLLDKYLSYGYAGAFVV